MRLRQGYIRAAGDKRLLEEMLRGAAEELRPKVRGFLHLLEKRVTGSPEKDLQTLAEATGAGESLMDAVRAEKGDPEERFDWLYQAVATLSEKADAHK